jgi:hypothetical protein
VRRFRGGQFSAFIRVGRRGRRPDELLDGGSGVVVQTTAVVGVVSSGSAGVSFCSEGWGLRKGVLLGVGLMSLSLLYEAKNKDKNGKQIKDLKTYRRQGHRSGGSLMCTVCRVTLDTGEGVVGSGEAAIPPIRWSLRDRNIPKKLV